MAFRNRWRISGTLSTTTPLHVGSGETIMRDALVDDSNAPVPVDIAAVATDHRQRAYIPGTTLKGNLRAWLNMHGISSSAIDAVFGSAEPSTPHAMGGKAEIWDAFATGTPDPSPQVPYWDANRLTGVSVAVAIDRRTRTASPNKLFHEEFVPPGISFEVTVTGQDLELGEPELLLYALEGFNHTEHPIMLGAGTGDGHGRFTWNLNDIARIETQEDIVAWLQQPNPPVGYDGLVSLTEADREAIGMRALCGWGSSTQPALTLTLSIHFDGPFLVNDPSRTKKGRPRSAVDEGIPNHAPLRDHQGRLMLPASSIRGALRSQAEKILRTLKAQTACLAVDSEDACAPIYDAD
jgi:CRISPR/Cas system CSM-associated protein Csm3 (group 7 of RAMP superfamily)